MEERLLAPFGRALDLGCGTGFSAVNLAKRGWQLTGIDFVTSLVCRAQTGARSWCPGSIMLGDITALRAAGGGSSFGFFLDLGAVHSLNETDRPTGGRPRGDSGRRARCHPTDRRLGARERRGPFGEA
jgi:SAM-dependent methyltransferase